MRKGRRRGRRRKRRIRRGRRRRRRRRIITEVGRLHLTYLTGQHITKYKLQHKNKTLTT